MTILRKTDPVDVQCVWRTIFHKMHQRLCCESEKIIKELATSNGSEAAKWRKCIEDMVFDKLLSKRPKKDDPKSRVIVFPETKSVTDKRDWYCFECHKPGDVKFCRTESCCRVFHDKCVPVVANNYFVLFYKISNSDSSKFLKGTRRNRDRSLTVDPLEQKQYMTKYDVDKCIICNLNQLNDLSIEKSDFKHVLKYLHKESKDWVPKKITQKMKNAEPYPEWINENCLKISADYLLFFPTDILSIDSNIEKGRYSKFPEYLADILTVKHNIGIFHGCASQEYEAAEYFLKDVFHDLAEIACCVDCFKHSWESKTNKDWFSLPCRTPHEIVWAKHGSYCYWPAKVIKKNDSIYDVRFFGGNHERAYVEKDFIKPANTPESSLKLKKTKSLLKAIDEMRSLLKNVKNPAEPESHGNIHKEGIKKMGSPNPPVKKKPLNKKRSLVRISHIRKERILPKDEPENGKASISFMEPSSSSTPIVDDVPLKRRKISKGPVKKLEVYLNEEPIKISDDEENVYTFSGSLTKSAMEFSTEVPDDNEDPEVELVTSSTECVNSREVRSNQELPQLNQNHSESVEMMKKALQSIHAKEDIIQTAMDIMQTEINRLAEYHKEELRKLSETHRAEISSTKKKQWCVICERDAFYHCCWNTAYCSVPCQNQHWQQEHKHNCKRKRE